MMKVMYRERLLGLIFQQPSGKWVAVSYKNLSGKVSRHVSIQHAKNRIAEHNGYSPFYCTLT